MYLLLYQRICAGDGRVCITNGGTSSRFLRRYSPFHECVAIKIQHHKKHAEFTFAMKHFDRNLSITISRESGQAMVETLLTIVIFTTIAFGALQLSIMALDDMICNEAAFASVRSSVVSRHTQGQTNARDCARILLLPHLNRKNLMYEDMGEWSNTPLGKGHGDHTQHDIIKSNINIRYRINLAFASLIKPALLAGNLVQHTARARMVKSPDEKYYYKAYPEAMNFTETPDE